ncbi:T9SS type A sorting domain-containing protein [Reichenbachiella ulvae]|uniref:T9SS type A sorting domain-containing protein n=1 Tax=Reichenbachiella ulvae TaxID=2980104 RepID=A0ABT3CRQ3_9BACT|nr:T9SS type A sorting domain-containing protein [Reichenbachiella ulvae]MCV9386391.1 T9SS type A sorting domain-containing protein [Reichenbachiella ulvae]
MKRIIPTVLALMIAHVSVSQTTINGFAKVTGISGTVVSVSDVDETSDSFEVGNELILMQMQDDVIGLNTADDASFGDLGDIGSAGLYELATISSVDRSSGLVSITLDEAPTNTYTVSSNTSVQVITLPSYANFSTSSDLTTKAWDGNVGGVFAIDVENTLTLAHSIDVSELGFRGGGQNTVGTDGTCNSTTYATSSTVDFSEKGEGIYKSTNSAYNNGRGKILNGGGGANVHNGGGGGGGNYTAGGNGGDGVGASCEAEGLGGIDLSDNISSSRIFMGGGGGGGHQNDTNGSDGANGGGIILIRAGEILINASCGGLSISANGGSSSDAGNDGVGGSGAGGAIVFSVDTWSLGCDLTLQANGGNGGNVGSTTAHGGGGGGGKGVIFMNGSAPVSNFTTEVNQGTGGLNDSDFEDGSADSGNTTPSNVDADPTGMVMVSSSPLPVELKYWDFELSDDKVILNWATSVEINNEYFTLEKSLDGKKWTVLTMIAGAGNSNELIRYDYIDFNPGLENYYRLSQTDYDGDTESFEVLKVTNSLNHENVIVYPNPSKGVLKLAIHPQNYSLSLVDLTGKSFEITSYWKGNELIVDTHEAPNGIYFLELVLNSGKQRFKLLIE